MIAWRMAIVSLPLACIAAADAAPPEMKAGMWRTTLVIASETPVVTTRCRSAHRLELPEMGQGACRAVRERIAGGVIDVARVCGGRTVTATGRYSGTSMSLTVTGMEILRGRPSNLSISASRIAACTPEDDDLDDTDE